LFPSKDVLDNPNSKGTTCRRLLDGLRIKADIENAQSETESSSDKNVEFEDEAESLSNNFQQRLDYLASEEYFEFQGKFERYDVGGGIDAPDETYNEWADRIFSEFRRKHSTRTETSSSKKSEKGKTEPPAPKLVPKLKLVSEQNKRTLDIYLVKFKKLFESSEELAVKDLPFSEDSSAEKIIETILWKADNDVTSRDRLRDALRKWHPDKFAQLTQARIKNEDEKTKMFRIVTHVSQVLLNYGK